MRKFLFIAAAAFASCNMGNKADTKLATAIAPTAVDYGVPIEYSAQFEMGDPKFSKAVVALWQDFDNNTLQNSKDRFADTVTMEFSGMRMHGTKDSILNATQGYRNTVAGVKSSIAALMSTKSVDKNEDWVCIWGTEVRTSKAGKKDSSYLHEIWHFNKQGKVDYMSQYVQQPPAK